MRRYAACAHEILNDCSILFAFIGCWSMKCRNNNRSNHTVMLTNECSQCLLLPYSINSPIRSRLCTVFYACSVFYSMKTCSSASNYQTSESLNPLWCPTNAAKTENPITEKHRIQRRLSNQYAMHGAHRNSQRDFDSHNVKHLHLQSCLTHDCAAIAIFPCSIFRWSVGSRTKWAWSALITNMPISFQNMPIAAQCLPAQSGRAIYKKQQQSGHQNENDHFKLWRSHEDAFQHSLVTMQRCIQTTLTTNATSVWCAMCVRGVGVTS